MATQLVDKITAPEIHPQVVQSCLQVIEDEVGKTSGMSGLAVKTGYKVVKALRPGMIRNAVEKLLPDFARALQPMYEASGAAEGGSGAGDKFAAHLTAQPEQAAEALLSVTDAKAARAENGTIRKTYDRLRGGAKNHVQAAIPNVATTLGKYA